jgi:AcrR family transcriptional regulator
MDASPWKKEEDRAQERKIKRAAVLRAAAQVFNEKGFHATSLDDVAARLNIAKPTLYYDALLLCREQRYYVASKDEILFECVRIGLEMMEEAADEVVARGGSGLGQLVAVMRKYAEIVTMDFGRCLIRVGEEPMPPASRKKLRGLKARIDRRFRALIVRCIADGSFAPRDAKITGFTVAGALSWIARWYRADAALSHSEIADQCIDILIHGLLSRESPKLPSRNVASQRGAGTRARPRSVAVFKRP